MSIHVNVHAAEHECEHGVHHHVVLEKFLVGLHVYYDGGFGLDFDVFLEALRVGVSISLPLFLSVDSA